MFNLLHFENVPKPKATLSFPMASSSDSCLDETMCSAWQFLAPLKFKRHISLEFHLKFSNVEGHRDSSTFPFQNDPNFQREPQLSESKQKIKKPETYPNANNKKAAVFSNSSFERFKVPLNFFRLKETFSAV